MRSILLASAVALMVLCAGCKDEKKEDDSAAQQKALLKEKTREAVDMLDRICKGAAAYYTTPHVNMGDGMKLPCQFPASVGPTPGSRGCADKAVDKDGDAFCDPDPDVWAVPGWSALMFEMNDPHRFVYSFASKGTGADAEFVATANGDLDGDGVLSTFQRFGKGAAESGGECTLGPTAFRTENDLE
ncbi:MAG: hypothetical protein FJ098_06355 [Deltaproteobacteria bacterium]|nr:hypothetical protein [Deltaproteobacteria bacterium]